MPAGLSSLAISSFPHRPLHRRDADGDGRGPAKKGLSQKPHKLSASKVQLPLTSLGWCVITEPWGAASLIKKSPAESQADVLLIGVATK